MNIRRISAILRKDISIGPRSPIVLFAIVLPLALTLVLQLAFGGFFDDSPRAAVLDSGTSQVSQELEQYPGIRTTPLQDAQRMQQRVERGQYALGLQIPAGFDADLRSGSMPELGMQVYDGSSILDRMVLTIAVIDSIRAVQGLTPPVEAEIVQADSADPIPLSRRFVPIIAMYAFVMAGLFAPASSMVEEREHRTVIAVLTTPTTPAEYFTAKTLFGVFLSLATSIITLQLNSALGPDYLAMIVVLAITSAFWALLGLLIGIIAKSSESLFAIVKASGAILFVPVIFYLFPDWPDWIARIFPTYYAIDPVWQIMSHGAGLSDVVPSLLVVAGMCGILTLIASLLAPRMTARLG